MTHHPKSASAIGPSRRALGVGHFLVMEILERAQALEDRGEDVVHLEVGEPDFDTPESAAEAGISAIRRGRTHYTHSLGYRPLREAIARRTTETYGVEIDPERVVVTMGSSAALLLAFAVLADPGDEVIVGDPGYPCYGNIAKGLGIESVPVPLRPENDFVPDAAEVRARIGDRTRAIVLNSPANPTGAVIPRGVLAELAELGPPVVSDEIYHGLVYEGEAPSALEVRPDAFVVGGFSKRYAMTGWRLGYLIVPAGVLRQVQALAQNLFVSPPDFGQHAALAALDAGETVEGMRRRFDERRRFLTDALPRIGLPPAARPRGAFYVFCDASRYTDDSMAFALELLEQTKVAVTPGVDFGARGEGFLRFSYATSLERLEEGVRRLGSYLEGR